MNRDDIIQMAREAGFTASEIAWHDEMFERFAALVAAAEREACAKECKFGRSSADIEQAIRARGENT